MLTRIGCLFLGVVVLSYVQIFADEGSSDQTPTPIYYTSCCPIEIDFTLALDSFRSLPEGSFGNNWGGITALNLKAPLPASFSIQLAGSYGLYDWYGRSSTPSKGSGSLQQQGFITLAASRQTEESSGLNAGLAYDCMLNKNFGLFATNPFFYQIRGQMGYLIRASNEVGVWASYGIMLLMKRLSKSLFGSEPSARSISFGVTTIKITVIP